MNTFSFFAFFARMQVMKKKPFLDRFSEKFHRKESLFRKCVRGFFNFFLSPKGVLSIFLLLLLGGFFWIRSVLGVFDMLFWNIPSMSGLTEEKTYLLLLQNENEIRATGGFITSYAVVHSNGFSQEIEFYNSEEVTIPDPQIKAPEAIERVLSRDEKYAGWVFRDTNYDLDYFRNVERALQFLKYDERLHSVEFDGVIAIDTAFLGEIVDLTGPFVIEGKTITGENVFEVLEFTSKNFDHHNEEQWKTRKSNLEPLANEIKTRILKTPSLWREFFLLLEEQANEKHIVFYFTDSDIQKKFQRKNWTGEIPTEPFWTVNFTNLGGRKGDRYLRKTYHSSIHVDETGKTTEEFSISISHEGTYNLQSDRYEAFVRFVRPKGVDLLDYSGLFETEPVQRTEEYGEEVSFFIVLFPGDDSVLNFSLEYPEEYSFLTRDTLQILFEKQIGSGQEPWFLTVRGENDVRFSSDSCEQERKRENIYFCDILLNTDKKLTITKHPDTTPPLLQFARFKGISSMEVRFSEDIASTILPNDITLTDLDYRSGGTDTFTIQDVEVDGVSVFITFSGLTENAGERYQLHIDSVQDISGNLYETGTLLPGEFQVTVLQYEGDI